MQKLKFVLGRVENIVGKGENAELPAFSPFPTMFSKYYFFRVVKGGYFDFSHLIKLKYLSITEIYMKKQYKSSRIKNHKITKKIF